ncbi:hypothetical protein GCM10027169_13130 [Gordonia jinhuaensis]|uniref:Uncharacterized protein n=1 Tax=Gordonia jinhuaensis TaxID=1517702 RepID=A0A916T062_9ACTN|nr:hypothetical protein [Gordonia jinhuaensis]GGB22578.1 hypothetical protein GCM10011489_08470 [Gordonia jinhuaensis]
MAVTVNWDGDNTLNDDDLERGLLAGAELLLDESNRKAPIETGALIRSGTAVAQGNQAAVGYNTPYAVRQHEEVGYHHDAGREAKFLENALHNHKDQILGAIGDAIREGLT